MNFKYNKETALKSLREIIPLVLREKRQWVCWKSEIINGRKTKMPYQVTGGKASTANPATWCDFLPAVNALDTGRFNGVGFVFTQEAGIVGIDLDHVRDPDAGEITESWAVGIIECLSSYTEVSPSGDGLHILCAGQLPASGGNDGCETSGAHMEMYQAGRYFTITGKVLDGYERLVTPPEGVLDDVWNFMKTRKPPKPPDESPKDRTFQDGVYAWDGDIQHLPIKSETKSLILNGAPRGQRSEAIMLVLNALVYSCLSDEQIFGIFQAYEIGQKWRDEKHSREIWLSAQIAKARAFTTSRATEQRERDDHQQHDHEDREGAETAPPVNRFAWIRDIKLGKPKWVIPGYLEENGFGLLFGDPGSFKSFIALDWALRVATGATFTGRRVKQGVVVIIAGEGIVGIPRRIKAWCFRHNVDYAALPVAVSKCPTALTDPNDTADTILNIKALVGNQDVRMIIVDTVARNYGGKDENSTQDMSGFIASCDRIRTEFSSAVLAVHHCGLGDKSRSRGSIALKGALDCEYRIVRDSDNNCMIHCTKMKEAAEPPDMALKPVTMDLGEVDEDGEPVTSLVFERIEGYEPDKKPTPAAGNGQKQKIMKTILKEMIVERDKNLVDSGREPAGCIMLSDWRRRLKEFGVTSKNIRDNLSAFTEKDGYVFLNAQK